MEANRNNMGLGTGPQGFNPGRQGQDDTFESSPPDTGPGREAQGRTNNKEDVRSVVQGGKQAARQAVNEGKQAAREIGQEVKQQAREVVQDLKGSADEYLAQGTKAISGQIGCISRALHSAADEMCEDAAGQRVGKLTHSLAGSLESAVDYIQNREPRDIVRSVEDFARREPVIFLSGCLLAGVLAARFLKASSPGHDREFDQWRQHRDSAGNLGTSGPMDEHPPRGPLERSGLGYGATPVDISPKPPDMPPNLGGGV
jgi:vacuolar-type H+-ATPase subunit H